MLDMNDEREDVSPVGGTGMGAGAAAADAPPPKLKENGDGAAGAGAIGVGVDAELDGVSGVSSTARFFSVSRMPW